MVFEYYPDTDMLYIKKVILFGSFAKGRRDLFTDLDLSALSSATRSSQVRCYMRENSKAEDSAG
ncbi:MAG TPA: hypothetical protein VE136_04175 [Anaerolineales bacterium]|jgi:predicted nucleotidyltransferase|nr:hypothetical protein [Anaerolineales bacterium]